MRSLRAFRRNTSLVSLIIRQIDFVGGKLRSWQHLKTTTFLILLCAFPAQSQELMSKPIWANDLVVSVPTVLCVPEQTFLACFDTDANGCTRTMEKVAEDCLTSLDTEIPDMLNTAEQIEWGTAVGICMGNSYPVEMASISKPCDTSAQSVAGTQSAKLTTKEMWRSELVNVMPPTLCQPIQYFMNCFNVDANQCSETVRTVSQDCFTNIDKDVPEMLSETEKLAWGNVLGQCIGTAYVTQLIRDGKKKTGPGC